MLPRSRLSAPALMVAVLASPEVWSGSCTCRPPAHSCPPGARLRARCSCERLPLHVQLRKAQGPGSIMLTDAASVSRNFKVFCIEFNVFLNKSP
eukprot:4348307-Prymnesium_polylepis.1